MTEHGLTHSPAERLLPPKAPAPPPPYHETGVGFANVALVFIVGACVVALVILGL